jgi:hypothetical protein
MIYGKPRHRQTPSWLIGTRDDLPNCFCIGVEDVVYRQKPLRYVPKTYGGLSELLQFVLLAAVTCALFGVIWLGIILSAG